MKETTKVFEIKKTVIREESDSEKIIFERKENYWVYHAPNAQDHTEEQLKQILNILIDLNKQK